MAFLYNSLLIILFPIIYLLLLLSKNGRTFLKNRQGTYKKLLSFQKKASSRVFWFHAASVGELEQCKAVIQVIRLKEPNSTVIQSVYSSSVASKHLDSPLFDFTFYLPLDFFWAYDKFFQKLQPNFLIIAAWDTWFNLLRKAKKYHCKIFLICATIHSNSKRLQFPFSLFTRKIFSYIDFVLPANELFREQFQRLIAKDKIGISADSRFDSVIQKIEKRTSPPPLPLSIQKIIIFASTYQEDEDLLFPLLPILLQEFTVWLFPHKVEEKNLKRIQRNLEKLNCHYILYSDTNFEHVQKLVLFDKLGILAHAYEKGFYTYVGGALHNRVHNVIEPAYFGLPVITGPKIQHAAEAEVLREGKGLFVIQTLEEFFAIHKQLVEQPNFYAKIHQFNKNFVQGMRGSSEKIYEFLSNF